jgi:hypothetical protein
MRFFGESAFIKRRPTRPAAKQWEKLKAHKRFRTSKQQFGIPKVDSSGYDFTILMDNFD